MDKIYDQTKVEGKWYKFWEEKGYFKPEINPEGKPYSIVLPPPNVTGNLHIGHALMLTIEDILIRYHRMLGDKTLWLPGADHAGFETQFVYEKKLQKELKKGSRVVSNNYCFPQWQAREEKDNVRLYIV